MALIKICNNFQVTTAPKSSTKVPADTSVFVPVLPETVPMFAQVWIHMQNFKWGWTFLLSSGSRCCCGAKTGDWWQSKGSNQPGEYFSVLEFFISRTSFFYFLSLSDIKTCHFFQVLPGYAPSYATDYVPPEVSMDINFTSHHNHNFDWKTLSLKSAGQRTLFFCFCEHYIIQCFPLPHTIRGEFSILYGSEPFALSDHLKCIHFERKWWLLGLALNQLRL